MKLPDWRAVGALYFGPAQCQKLAGLADVQRPKAFAQAWSAVEAQGKASQQNLAEWPA